MQLRVFLLVASLLMLLPADVLARAGGGSHGFSRRAPGFGGGGYGSRGRGFGGHHFFFFGGGGGGILLIIMIILVVLFLLSRSARARRS
ncbi:MAG: hypothetical protein M3296_07610 [Actinomycetota bacterium]|nr:hypothetical protein [Actinomycetota bacterium]